MELDDAGAGPPRATCALLGSLGGRVTVSCGMLVWVMNGVDLGRGGIGGTCVVTPGNIKLKVTPITKIRIHTFNNKNCKN